MTRMIFCVLRRLASVAIGSPATIDTITVSLRIPAAISRHATAACCGFTAKKIIPALATAPTPVAAKQIPGTRAAMRVRAIGSGSYTVRSAAVLRPARQKPSANAIAICPPPTIVIASKEMLAVVVWPMEGFLL